MSGTTHIGMISSEQITGWKGTRHSVGRRLSHYFTTLLLLLIFPFLADNAGADSLSANPSRECAICHYNWVEVFYKKGTGTDLVEYPQEKHVALELMCYSCHDGSISDSRFKVWETSRHKPGTKPSDKIDVPNIFPLDKEGRVQCFTCHSAHGVDTQPGIEATIFLRTSNRNSEMCMKCHVGKDRGPKKGSHPVGMVFNVPEEITNAGGKVGSKGQIICQTCHEPHGSTGDHFLVIPNSGEGVTHSALCETCHTQAPDIKEKTKMRKHSHPMDIAIIAEAKLPPKWENGEVPYLSFDGKINCRTCHSPHNGTNDNNILVEQNLKGSLCLHCHTSKASVANTKHDMTIMAPDLTNVKGKSAGEKGACSACHLMHKGTGPKMWARALGDGTDIIEEMCRSCHSDYGTGNLKQVGKESHPVGVDITKINAETDLPLFTVDGAKTGKRHEGRVVCGTCHNVHQWDPLDRNSVGGKKVEGDGRNSFLRVALDAKSDLCRNCHSEKFAVKETKHDLTLTSPKSVNLKQERPEQSGLCGSCHLPHNGTGPKMWARMERGDSPDPAANVCLGCHRKGGAAEKKITGEFSHPVGVPISNSDIHIVDTLWQPAHENVLTVGEFAVQEIIKLPLYDNHGRKVSDGNVSCGTCHDPHRWRPAQNGGDANQRATTDKDDIKKPGDGSSSFLRVENKEGSGLCVNCHTAKRPVAYTMHNLKYSAPDEENISGKKITASGVCSACHIPHNAAGPRLWSRKQDKKGPLDTARLCESCHVDKGIAGKKLVGDNSHPLRVELKPGMKETRLPVYGKDGKRDKEHGVVVCSSCHDPHQWDAENVNNMAGMQKGTEGDATNSFLRMGAGGDSLLCADCHQDKKWVAKTDHDMRMTSPDAKNFKGEGVEQSGICGQCHFVHNAKSARLIWAREAGPGQDFMDRACRSCHSNNSIAANKQPVKVTHPKDVIVVSSPKIVQKESEKGHYFPVYSPDGFVKMDGMITCPTCHDPHRWKPGVNDYGPARNIEGNATNSFLRNKSESAICAHCHGMDALFRYKFFHGETSRKKYSITGE